MRETIEECAIAPKMREGGASLNSENARVPETWNIERIIVAHGDLCLQASDLSDPDSRGRAGAPFPGMAV